MSATFTNEIFYRLQIGHTGQNVRRLVERQETHKIVDENSWIIGKNNVIISLGTLLSLYIH